MIYNVILISGVLQSDSVIHISIFFRFFSDIGYYRVLSRVPCAEVNVSTQLATSRARPRTQDLGSINL